MVRKRGGMAELFALLFFNHLPARLFSKAIEDPPTLDNCEYLLLGETTSVHLFEVQAEIHSLYPFSYPHTITCNYITHYICISLLSDTQSKKSSY